MVDILDGILIGGAGGAIAGLVVSLIKSGSSFVSEVRHKKRILRWLKENTSADGGNKLYRSTRAVASWNNLTEDRVRYICSIHKEIYMSTGKTEDLWSIYDSGRQALAKSMYSRP